eukprot:COSAG02_NODE_29981_length_559_cov_1.060870_2_plen_67_part_01
MYDVCSTRVTNATDRAFVAYVRRDEGEERRHGMRLWRVDAGDSHSINLPSLGASHILTFVFIGESDS